MIVAGSSFQNVLLNLSNGKRGLYYSSDWCNSFTCVLPNTASGQAIYQPTGSTDLYCVTVVPPALFVSHTGGKSWELKSGIDSEQITPYFAICSLGGFVNESGIHLYAGCSNPGKIIQSDDTGRTWKVTLADSAIASSEIPQIVVNSCGNLIVACMSSGIQTIHRSVYYHSLRDRGWISHSSPTNVWSITLDSASNRWWIGQFSKFDNNYPRASILESRDNGNSWNPLGDLQAKLVWMTTLTSSRKRLAAATDDGVFLVDVD